MREISIQESLRGKRILLTGASGFLGKVWLCMVLSRVPDVAGITVLLRPKSGRSAAERLEGIFNSSPAFKVLHEAYGPDLGKFLFSKLEAIEGDVGLEGFGISEEEVERLSGRIDLILNCAGLVDFHADLRKAFHANVQGGLNALELARRLGCPLLHVSTAFVAGSREGDISETPPRDYAPSDPAFDAEKDYAELKALIEGAPPAGLSWVDVGTKRASSKGWPNAYSYTKSLAESLLFARAGSVPVSSFRPAIVESSERFPFPGWNEGVTTCAPLSYLLSRWTRIVEINPTLSLDLIPVDAVCEGLTVVAAALMKGEAHPVYHCGTSDLNPLNARFAVELMGISQRERRRNDGTRTIEKKILTRVQPVFVGADSFFKAPKMRKLASLLSEAADLGAPHVPESAKGVFEFGRKILRRIRWDLIKAEKVVETFQPYLARYRHRFLAKNLKTHRVVEPEFRFRPETIAWTDYIVRIHEPGLQRWCYPLMEGRPAETFSPRYPCRLGATAEKKEEATRPIRRANENFTRA